MASVKKPRALRKDRHGWSPVKVGLGVLAVVIAVTYFGFTKHIPFTQGYQLKAVFQSANSIRPGSPVRIAGVNVGKVMRVEGVGAQQAAIVTMEIADVGLPIHKDATIKIRPRIFLEGNFFADLKPGTPSAPTLQDGDTLPITQTAAPVQLDELLTALQSDSRADLQDTLQGFGTALLYQPTAADDIGQDPDVKGKTGADALNGALTYSADAFKDGALVNQALLGTEPNDLSKLVDSVGKVAGGTFLVWAGLGVTGAVGALLGFDGDGERRADGLAQLAGNAAFFAVRIAAQRVQAAETRRLRCLFFRELHSDLAPEKVTPGDHQALDQLEQQEGAEEILDTGDHRVISTISTAASGSRCRQL